MEACWHEAHPLPLREQCMGFNPFSGYFTLSNLLHISVDQFLHLETRPHQRFSHTRNLWQLEIKNYPGINRWRLLVRGSKWRKTHSPSHRDSHPLAIRGLSSSCYEVGLMISQSSRPSRYDMGFSTLPNLKCVSAKSDHWQLGAWLLRVNKSETGAQAEHWLLVWETPSQ